MVWAGACLDAMVCGLEISGLSGMDGYIIPCTGVLVVRGATWPGSLPAACCTGLRRISNWMDDGSLGVLRSWDAVSIQAAPLQWPSGHPFEMPPLRTRGACAA